MMTMYLDVELENEERYDIEEMVEELSSIIERPQSIVKRLVEDCLENTYFESYGKLGWKFTQYQVETPRNLLFGYIDSLLNDIINGEDCDFDEDLLNDLIKYLEPDYKL